MIKVLIICGLPPNKAGEANYSFKVFERFNDQYESKVQTLFVSHIFENNEAEILDKRKWNVKRLTGRKNPFRIYFEVLREVFRFKPNIIHLQGVHTSLYGFLIGEPFILLTLLFRISGIKIVHTIHSTWLSKHLDEMFVSKKYNTFSKFLGKIYFRVMYYLICRIPHVIRILVAGENSNMHNEFAKFYWVNEKKIQLEIHPCEIKNIDHSLQERLKLKYNLTDKFVFLATGFVRRDKGYHLLLKAFQKLCLDHNHARLIIAGLPQGDDGDLYASELVQYVNENKLNNLVNLQFMFIDNKTYDDYFILANALVIPYTRAIGASGPIHQAISNGKNVIATNVDHNNGLKGVINLFDISNNDSLYDSLVDSIINQKKDEMNLIEYSKQHSWSLMADEYFLCYMDLLKNKLC